METSFHFFQLFCAFLANNKDCSTKMRVFLSKWTWSQLEESSWRHMTASAKIINNNSDSLAHSCLHPSHSQVMKIACRQPKRKTLPTDERNQLHTSTVFVSFSQVLAKVISQFDHLINPNRLIFEFIGWTQFLLHQYCQQSSEANFDRMGCLRKEHQDQSLWSNSLFLSSTKRIWKTNLFE